MCGRRGKEEAKRRVRRIVSPEACSRFRSLSLPFAHPSLMGCDGSQERLPSRIVQKLNRQGYAQ